MPLLEKVKEKLLGIKNTFYRNTTSVIAIRNSLEDKYPIEKAKIPVIIRQITETDAEEYCNARSINSKERMLDRLSKGHIGLCAIYEGKIVGFTWRSIDEIWIDEHKINLKLPPKHRYGYDGYTHPKYRRYGIFHELLTSSYSYFNEMGYPFLLSMISHDNEASLKALEKTGGKKLGTIHTTSFLWSVSHSIDSDNEENRKKIKDIFSL